MKSHLWRWVAAVAIGATIVLGGSIWVADRWTGPNHRGVGAPPPDLPVRNIELAGSAGVLRGWFVPGEPGGAAVVLLHGSQRTRRAMLGQARFLHAQGYATLLPDLRAHGESDGERNVFGLTESEDAAAAVDLLRRLAPGERIGAIGYSLGGAACLLGKEPLDVDALVLEAVYPDIETAVSNRLRLRLGALGPLFTPLLTWQIYPLWGIRTEQLRPIDAIRRVRAPVFLIAGADDPRTTLEDSQRLFAAASEPKQLWIVPGAAHVNFHRVAPEQYEDRVLGFLDRFLRNPRA